MMAEEVRDDGFGLPDLTPIPRWSSPHRPWALPTYEHIPIELAEALRSVINRHELRTGMPLPNSIAVTSPLAGDGVTTVSQAMATLVAQEMDRYVCWVDCGWLAQNGSALGHGPNLLDLLNDPTQIETAFQSSPDLPHLVALAPGPVPESKRNLIVRSPAFEELLAGLAEEFNHVIFDLPPILANANSMAILRQADASLVVVRQRSATVAQVQRAIDSTRPTPNLGVVLNRYRTRIPKRLRRLLDA